MYLTVSAIRGSGWFETRGKTTWPTRRVQRDERDGRALHGASGRDHRGDPERGVGKAWRSEAQTLGGAMVWTDNPLVRGGHTGRGGS